MARTILITGFGPFPGSPYNPTGPLVRQLARGKRLGVKIVPHIFETSYAAVDRDLRKLIAKHKPDALLMFGLASRARIIRVETRARNVLARLPDAAGKTPRRTTIVTGKPAAMIMPVPAHLMLAAIRKTGVRARLSRDAGRYLCNYLCWRAAEAAAKKGGPRIAAFVHVPRVAEKPGKKPGKLSPGDLNRAGAAALSALIKACHGSARKHP
ncbi:MAG: pyroglutamyl-peptidase I [Pseudolabrys sp.]